jgi:CubicO group peptidase (beta-lactamase class C family)
VADLATWMLFQLGDGSFRGRRLLSSEALGEMHSPQVLFSTTAAFRAARRVRFFAAYGMGWQVFDYRGSPFLWHTGGGDGSAASMALFPELGLGVAVLVNTSKLGSGFNLSVLTSRIADHYLGLPASDDTATFRAGHLRSQAREREEQRAADSTRQPSTGPSRPLPRFVGRYLDRLGLEVSVVLEADSLRLRYGGGERATLEHWHHDVFRARWENPWHDADHPTFVSFFVDGEVVSRLHLEPFGDPVDARRVER